MTKQRADIPFGEAFDSLDASEWKPEGKTKQEKIAVAKESVRKVAEKVGFSSREEKPTAPPAPEQGIVGQVYRTGRSDQLNLKVRTNDKTQFLQICASKKWVQGYAFQRAIEALERELKAEGQGSTALSKTA